MNASGSVSGTYHSKSRAILPKIAEGYRRTRREFGRHGDDEDFVTSAADQYSMGAYVPTQ